MCKKDRRRASSKHDRKSENTRFAFAFPGRPSDSSNGGFLFPIVGQTILANSAEIQISIFCFQGYLKLTDEINKNASRHWSYAIV